MVSHKTIEIGRGYRTFVYKGFVFHITQADNGAGWYCTLAYTQEGRHPINTAYFTSGDTHYYRMTDVMNGLKKEIDSGVIDIEEGSYRLPSRPQT